MPRSSDRPSFAEVNKENPVLVIGAAGIDIVGQLKGELNPETSCPAQIRTSFGGVARNVAENLARLGHPVHLISVVGSDHAGDRIIQQAEDAGINVQLVVRNSEFPTGAYLGIVNMDGELIFALDDMRIIDTLSVDTIKQNSALFGDVSLVFVDTNLSKDVLRTIITLARRANIPICADPTSTALADKLAVHLPKLALISPNASEAGVLTGHPFNPANRGEALEVAKILVSKGVEIAIVTLGKYGLCYATSETSGYIPTFHTKVLDPTGAGDALSATVIFALLNDIPLDDAVRLGVSAACLTLSYPGAVLSDLSLEKLYDQLVI